MSHAALALPAHKPAEALDLTLAEIRARHGERTSDMVAVQLEDPRQAIDPDQQPRPAEGAVETDPD